MMGLRAETHLTLSQGPKQGLSEQDGQARPQGDISGIDVAVGCIPQLWEQGHGPTSVLPVSLFASGSMHLGTKRLTALSRY